VSKTFVRLTKKIESLLSIQKDCLHFKQIVLAFPTLHCDFNLTLLSSILEINTSTVKVAFVITLGQIKSDVNNQFITITGDYHLE